MIQKTLWVFCDCSEVFQNDPEPHYAYDLLASTREALFTGLLVLFYRDEKSARVLKLLPVELPVDEIPRQYLPWTETENYIIRSGGYFCRSDADKHLPKVYKISVDQFQDDLGHDRPR